MVIDGEEHGARPLGGIAQPHRGAPAIRADFQERTTRILGTGAQRGRVEGVALLGWHETFGGERDLAPRHH
jgi:hypothetical protein